MTFLHGGKTISYPAWTGTKKDPTGLLFSRTMFEFSVSDNSPFNICKWKLKAKDFSLYLVLVLLHSSTYLVVGSRCMLFEVVQEPMLKPNTISATRLGDKLWVYRQIISKRIFKLQLQMVHKYKLSCCIQSEYQREDAWMNEIRCQWTQSLDMLFYRIKVSPVFLKW